MFYELHQGECMHHAQIYSPLLEPAQLILLKAATNNFQWKPNLLRVKEIFSVVTCV
jgi:hypothetical protein